MSGFRFYLVISACWFSLTCLIGCGCEDEEKAQTDDAADDGAAYTDGSVISDSKTKKATPVYDATGDRDLDAATPDVKTDAILPDANADAVSPDSGTDKNSENQPPETSADPTGGVFNTDVQVTLSCDDGDGSGCYHTYYTIDGSGPDVDSFIYDSPISITTDTTLKFYSVDNDGNSETIQTQVYTFDRQAPAIVACIPGDAEDVPVGVVITIEFDEPIDEDSLSDRLELRIGNASLDATVSYDDATETATLIPHRRLDYDESYTIHLASGVTDLPGNAIDEDSSWEFSTPTDHPSPSNPPATSGLATHRAPRVAVDADGNAMAVWEVDQRGTSKVVAAFYDAVSESWSVEQNVGLNGFAPDVASLAADDFMLVWIENDGYSRDLMASRYIDGVFETPVNVDGLTGSVWEPRVASNGTGYAAVWRQQLTRAEMYASIWSSGVGWGDATSLESEGSISNDVTPEIASNGTGYAVVWASMSGSDQNIHVSVYDGASWPSDPYELESDADQFGNLPQIASNGTGYAVTWYQQDDVSDRWSVFASIGDGSATGWQAVADEVDGGDGNARTPDIVASGAAYIVVFIQDDGTANSVYANIGDGSADGWQATPTLLETSDVAADAVTIAATGGDLMVSYRQGGDIYGVAYSSSTWSAPEALDGSDQAAEEPFLAALGGEFVLAFSQIRGADPRSGISARIHGGIGWGDEVNLVTKDHRTVSNQLTMAVNDAHQSMLVWTQSHNGTRYLFSSFDDGSGYGTPEVISGPSADYAHLASDGSDFVVAWVDPDSYDINIRVYDSQNERWESITNFGQSDAQFLELAASHDGYIVAWVSDGLPLRARVYQDQTWGDIHDLNDADDTVEQLDIAGNGTGYAVAWHEIRADGDHVRASIFDNGSFQSESAAELSDSTNDLRDVRIAGNALGYAVGFIQDDGSADSLFVSRGDGTPTGWPATAQLIESEDEENIDDYPAVAAARDGYAAVFVIYDGSSANDAKVNVFEQDAWQSAAETIDSAALDVRAVELQSNGYGYCSTFRVRDGDNSGTIYANIWSDGGWLDDPWLIQTGTNLRYYENDRVVIIPDGRLYDLAWVQNDPSDPVDPHIRTVWVLRGL